MNKAKIIFVVVMELAIIGGIAAIWFKLDQIHWTLTFLG